MKKTVCVVAVMLALCFAGYASGQAAAGETCDPSANPPVTCAENFYCETDKCKIKSGGNCENNADHCVMGATCENNVCTCPAATHTPSADNTKCLVKIGQDCTAEMCVEGATCNTTCKCPEMSKANADNDKCLMYIGQSCTESTDCVDSTNGMCNSDKKCACKEMYIPADNLMMCKLKAGATCDTASPMCGANAKCNATTTKCDCDVGFENEEGRCGKKVGADCGPTMPCVLNAECKASKCACKDDYTADGDFCRSGSTAAAASALLLIAAFVTSRLM